MRVALDAGWITVACRKEHFWRRLCDAAERTELAARYPTFADRHRDRDELLAILHELFLQRSSDEWLTLLNACGVAAGPVNDVATAFQDPQAVARGTLVDVEHPRLGTVRHIASPLRVDDEPPPIRRAEEQAPSQWLMVNVSGHLSIDG